MTKLHLILCVYHGPQVLEALTLRLAHVEVPNGACPLVLCIENATRDSRSNLKNESQSPLCKFEDHITYG